MNDAAHGWPEIGALHQALIEAGQSIALSELEHGIYGTSTKAAVSAYQREHGLTVDGIAGPVTMASLTGVGPSDRFTAPGWRAEPSQAAPGLVEVIKAAVGEIGTVEDPPGSNRGAKPYLRGYPWCLEFLSYCFRAATPASPFGHLTACWDLYSWAKRDASRRLVSTPAIGDVGLILRGDGVKERHGHAALVVAVLPDGRLATCEGNAANAVRGRVRMRTAFTVVVRPVPG